MQVDKLTKQLIDSGVLKTPIIIDAFNGLKRSDFIPFENKKFSDIDRPIPIGFSQTISQPTTVAFMLELLAPKRGEKILDIGSGSGWTTALLTKIVGSKGKVYAVERIKELKEFGENNVNKYFPNSRTVQFFCSDGYLGLSDFSPFDKILVSAAPEKIPDKLIAQLTVGGTLVIPIGNYYHQDIVQVKKNYENEIQLKNYPGFVFVPLVKN